MSQKRPRIIGTTDEAIDKAEAALDRKLPPSLRSWLIQNNGLGIEDITIFPVLDQRDPRTTWDSIDKRVNTGWKDWISNFDEDSGAFSHLLPFADFGSGDYYCLDYSRVNPQGEPPVVKWSHETGETEHRADSFSEFAIMAKEGEFSGD
ncbi:SMI1/KNR4 family protein [Prosthecobacter vanneervenii]|uniref:Cell wall assembly regulator SMI1 n=1 Tax=Prosthecobacter vanneervenii TaxID=48466 RepID=A0A7W7Y9D5_9BACT|nr:SMI1/KNR4 family protein [Prosthecobacter vanneervenii]MBB5032053.1 cell wall assembly regulator SMI1 [Prosthecobacter vanneervenii]